MIASGLMILVIFGILLGITVRGHWPYLWWEWLTSVDHKHIGVMYCLLALVMLLRAFTDAAMMRLQQALAAGGDRGYLPAEYFDQVFSAYGTIMIFFVAMPFVFGLMNFLGGFVHPRLSHGGPLMSDAPHDRAPGEEDPGVGRETVLTGLCSYGTGLLGAVSFWAAGTGVRVAAEQKTSVGQEPQQIRLSRLNGVDPSEAGW